MKHAILLALALATAGVAHGAGSGAKALFYSGEGTTIAAGQAAAPAAPPAAPPPEKPAQPAAAPSGEKYMGIAYWVDLAGQDGRRARTTTRREFSSGDRIKLGFKSNRDGYLYVSSLGSTGTSRLMFPRPGGGNNFIRANQEYSVPDGSYMRFDEHTGTETLLLVLSPTPIADLSPAAPGMDAPATRKFVAYADSNGAKDLLLEDDADSAKASPASYVVAPAATLQHGKVITLYIRLKHGK